MEDDTASTIEERVLRNAERLLGAPPRRHGFLRLRHLRSSPPSWLTAQDLISRIYQQKRQIVRNGSVRWATVVHANSGLFLPGPDTRGTQVVYAPNGDVPLTELQKVARQMFALKGSVPSDAGERRIANMLTDEMERALDWAVPTSISGGRNIVTTIVMIPWHQVPGGFLAMNYFPVLAEPTTSLAILVPFQYWSVDFAGEWNRSAEQALNLLESQPVVQLTPAAAAVAEEIAYDKSLRKYWIRVGVKLHRTGGFEYALDLTETPPSATGDLVMESCSLTIAVSRAHRSYLQGTVVDYRDDSSGKGFLFNCAEHRRVES